MDKEGEKELREVEDPKQIHLNWQKKSQEWLASKFTFLSSLLGFY